MDKIKALFMLLKGDWKTSVPGMVIMFATALYAFDYIDSIKFGVICAMASGIIGLVAADSKTEEKKQEIFDDRSDKREEEKPKPAPRPPYKPVGK